MQHSDWLLDQIHSKISCNSTLATLFKSPVCCKLAKSGQWLQAAQGSCGVTAGTAAAVAASLRVLQLTSSASQPAVPAEASRQVLQEINRAAGQSDKGASSVLLTCMAEAVGLQQIISEQVSVMSTVDLAVSSKAACNRRRWGFSVCF